MLFTLSNRWRLAPLKAAQSSDHVLVCPPPTDTAGLRTRLWNWLRFGAFDDREATAHASAVRRNAANLADVQRDFVEATVGVPSWKSADLRDRIGRARSLRELWHLRIDVFTFVSLHFDQHEADERLAWINRHFPTRNARSGFGELHALPNREFK